MSKLTINLGNGQAVDSTGGETVSLDDIDVRNLRGERLTDDNVDAEIREIAARLGGRGGRPRIAHDEDTVGLSVKVPASVRDAVKARAKADRVRQADVLRAAVEAYLEAV